MVCDAGDDGAQVCCGVSVVELGSLDERVDGGSAFAARVRAREEPVLGAKLEWPDGSLGGVVGDVEPAVIEITGERRPARTNIADGFGEIALAGLS